ncbi:hypothetical protein P5V15_005399 [Pogonomyrmex californicus]
MDVFFLLCTLCVIAVISVILPRIYQHYVLRKKLKHLPQIKANPIFGIIFQILKLSEWERILWFYDLMKQYKNGIYGYWLGNKAFVNIYHPDYLEAIFPSTVNITKGEPYDMLRPWLGNGLLTSTGKQWFHDRRLIGPTFHFSILNQFAVVLSEKAEILTKCLEKEIRKDPGKAINIFPFIINVALDIICETAMGVNVRAQEVVTEYTSTVHKTSTLILERLFRPWYWSDLLYYSFPAGKQYKSALNILHRFTKEVIIKKKSVREKQNGHVEFEDKNDNSDIGKRKRKAFLDLLLDQNEKDDTPLTDDEVRAQVDTFMFEGHDTTAVGMTWALFLLGSHPEYQEKVHKELEEVFGDSETPATVKELSELKYLDRVIKETLRLYPSVPMISRELVEDVTVGNYTFPKGITVVLAILLMHRNPVVWPDPDKFDPDRFLPENSANRNPYAYVPFSAGPRNCIGQRFAMLEEKTVLTAILRKWRIKSVKTPDMVKYGGSIILRPNEDIPIHFIPKK